MNIPNQLQTEFTIKKLPSFATVNEHASRGITRTYITPTEHFADRTTLDIIKSYAICELYRTTYERNTFPDNYAPLKGWMKEGHLYTNCGHAVDDYRAELERRGALDGLTIYDTASMELLRAKRIRRNIISPTE